MEKYVLSKIKKRMCHTSNDDVSLIPNTRIKRIIKKIVIEDDEGLEPVKVRVPKVYDNFQDVMVFQTNDALLMKAICKTIWLHNLDENNEIFMVFIPKIMNTIAAAVTIQQSVRTYRIRKRQRALITRN